LVLLRCPPLPGRYEPELGVSGTEDSTEGFAVLLIRPPDSPTLLPGDSVPVKITTHAPGAPDVFVDCLGQLSSTHRLTGHGA
jgi:hypothetical protein